MVIENEMLNVVVHGREAGQFQRGMETVKKRSVEVGTGTEETDQEDI